MAELKTNYVDDVLDSSKNQLRKYQQIQNDDGTVSFVDVTEYSTTGTSFGAKDINDTNAAVNELNNSLEKIGFYNSANGKEVSVPNSKDTVIQSLTLTEGVWDIVCNVVEPTGFKSNYLIGIRGICSVACPSFSGFVTPTRQFHTILKLTIPTTIAIFVHHTKGSAANFKSTIYAVRIN